MSKKTISLIAIAVFLAGILVIKEYIDNKAKNKEEPQKTKPEVEPFKMTEPTPEKDADKLIIKTSGVVTFLLTSDNVIYYYKGAFTGILNKTDYKKVREIIKTYKAEIDLKDLMFVIKSDPSASFKNAIDLLDEMEINKIPKGHYLETELTEEEIKSIKKYNDN